jgi:hypothetical protein
MGLYKKYTRPIYDPIIIYHIATKYGFNLHLEIYIQFLNESLQNLHQRIMQLKFSKKYRTNHGNIYIITHNTMLYRLVIPL